MDGTVTIYALCEPDGRPRYIGQTGRTLEQRLYEHLHEPYAAASQQFPRCVWIASLLAAGQAPVIRAIEVVDEARANAVERAYIADYPAQGYNLVNGTHTPQYRAKIVAVNRAHWARWKARRAERPAPERVSVKLNVPRDLYDELAALSGAGGWSLHTEMIRGLREHVKRERRRVAIARVVS